MKNILTTPIHPAPRADIVETFHGVAVADPFRPLEDADAAATKAWIEAQNNRTAEFVAPQADTIAALTQQMEQYMSYPRHSVPSHYGDYWFRTFNPGLAPQEVHQVAAAPTGPWRTVLDPLQLDPSGVTSISTFAPSLDGTRIAYATSVGGDDMVTLYVMDTATGTLLPDTITKCRWPDPQWDADGMGFHYSHSPGDGTKRRIVKHHKLGTDTTTDPVIFAHEHPESIAHYHRSRITGVEFISVRIGTDKSTGCWWRPTVDAAYACLIPPQQEEINIIDYLNGMMYATSKKNAPLGELVTFNPATPDTRTVLVAAEPAAVLDSAWHRHGKLYLSYSDDTADRIDIIGLDGTPQGRMPLPPQSTIGFGRDNLDDNGCYVAVSGYLTPGTKYFYDYTTNQLQFFAASECPVSLDGCVLERVRVRSHDGTIVPMTIIRDPSVVLDGTAATRMYGYGGFNVSLTPAFSPLRMATWVKQGGIFVICNLRGGGEYGTAWHEGGIKRNKMNTFHDFAACGQWLIDNNYTSAKRLVSEGGSNGGLLVLATMHLYPQLFGAVISHVPVTDMLRFDLHTYGAYWKSDYGDPKVDADDFAVTMQYSPLHTVKADVAYPPHLVLTADKDTRVVAMHSLKYVATMQSVAEHDTQSFLRVEVDAGHGAGTALQKTIAENALIIGFIQQAIGPINQAAYRT